VKFDGEVEGTPQFKKYKLALKSHTDSSLQSESNNSYCEDDNMSEVI
jgi:hypothetical protein